MLPKYLEILFQEQKSRYGELFWHQVENNKIVLMIETLAQRARELSEREGVKNIAIVSFEADDSIGEFYLVEAEQIDVETKPSKQEYQSIIDSEIVTVPEMQVNDISQDQLIRVYQPKGHQSFCAVVYHSFGNQTPRQIGWVKDLDGLKKINKDQVYQRLAPSRVEGENFVSFEQACKKLEGVKYQIGGGSFKNGFDCSALVQRIFYETKGIWLPRKARWQQMVCEKIDQKDLKQGDLVFFNKVVDLEQSLGDNVEKKVDHVVIFYGLQIVTDDGQMQETSGERSLTIFHAKRINGKAMFEDLNQARWLKKEDSPDGGWEISGYGRVICS